MTFIAIVGKYSSTLIVSSFSSEEIINANFGGIIV